MPDFKFNIDPRATNLAVGMRPRADAFALPDGTYAPADMEITISICVGVTKEASVLNAGGQRQGQMVAIATFAQPLSEFIAQARRQLGAQDEASDQAAAKELRAGLSLV